MLRDRCAIGLLKLEFTLPLESCLPMFGEVEVPNTLFTLFAEPVLTNGGCDCIEFITEMSMLVGSIPEFSLDMLCFEICGTMDAKWASKFRRIER